MMNADSWATRFCVAAATFGVLMTGCGTGGSDAVGEIDDATVDELVLRSWPYVAMFNVNNKFAMSQGGWNTVVPDTGLKDHTMTDIARPNNDTLYIGCMLDLRDDAVVLEWPAFDSDYVSLMITAYDHYVNVPASTRLGDFQRPEKMLVYSARTRDFDGGEIDGIDRQFQASGDFVSAVFRVMPHSGDAARFEEIKGQMREVTLQTLSEFRGEPPREVEEPEMPAVGASDLDVFGSNLFEVMQFVLNHTDFDPEDPVEAVVLSLYEPFGLVPGGDVEAAGRIPVEGKRLRAAAERVAAEKLALASDPEFKEQSLARLFLPKGQTNSELLLFQSVIGPIGLPAAEAVYPAIDTADGEPMNALHDYVIRMAPGELPPAGAFWSVTLYDLERGHFVPNDRKKYSVGANAGMKLDADGGIAIHIAAEQPAGVPPENWLPIVRRDEEIGPILRIYEPDLEAMKTWPVPVAEKVGP